MFLQFLKDWNGGILRGAQAKFARTIGVSKVTVMSWANGSMIPSEVQFKKMAKIFGKPEEKINNIFYKSTSIIKINPPENCVYQRLINIQQE